MQGLMTCACLSIQAGWHSDTQPIMGTRVAVELWMEAAETEATLAGEDQTAVSEGHRLVAAVMDEMRRIDARFSPYITDSELSMLNRRAALGWMTVSPEMFALLERSATVSRLTEGAFDITYASVGRYYDYREGKRPEADEQAEGLDAINYRYVELDPERLRVRYTHPHVYVDLGGIAKGHAVDRCVTLLQRAGVAHASVEAGGDSRIIGDRRGRPWTIGIRDPRNETGMSAVLPLTDTAVSTSGDYERYFIEDGVRYHHILDPSTGESARKLQSVTILGAEATFTDALSTSVFVLGPEAGLELIDKIEGVDAIIVDGAGELRYSSDLEPLAAR